MKLKIVQKLTLLNSQSLLSSGTKLIVFIRLKIDMQLSVLHQSRGFSIDVTITLYNALVRTNLECNAFRLHRAKYSFM
jgi:hypothetical protein